MPSRFLICISRTAALLLALTPIVGLAQTKPPVAVIKDVVETHYGVEVHDPYRYMEDVKDPEIAG